MSKHQNTCTVCLPSSTSHSRCQNACAKCVPYASSHRLSGSPYTFPDDLPSSTSFLCGENALPAVKIRATTIQSCDITFPAVKTCFRTYTILQQPFLKSKCVSRTSTILTPFQKSKHVYQTSNHITQFFMITKRVYKTCTILTRPFQRSNACIEHLLACTKCFLTSKHISRRSTILTHPFLK